MATYEIIEVEATYREWQAKKGPAAGQTFHSYTVTAKGPDGVEKTYEVSRKPTSPVLQPGPVEAEVKPSTGDFPDKLKILPQGGGGFGGGGGAKDAYWQAKEQRDIEGIARMGRAHAQEMSLTLLHLMLDIDSERFVKQMDDEAGLWSMVERWTDRFQQDVDNTTGADVGGGDLAHASRENRPAPAADVSAVPISEKQVDFLERLMRDGNVDPDASSLVGAWARAVLTGGREGTASKAIDGLKGDDPAGTFSRLLSAAQKWEDEQPNGPAPDTADLPPAEGTLADDEAVPF